MISLAGLNHNQREAAGTIDGPVLILAGAGSGKTRTITYRVAHMIDNCGISPKQILGVSFTNKAAKEMHERVSTLLGKRKTRGLTLATFHSLGVRILKKEIHRLGYHPNFSIYDTSDQLAIIREGLKSYKAEKKFDRKAVHGKIGLLKNHGIGVEEFPESPFFDEDDPYDYAVQYVYDYYQDKLKFCNAIDFDDILYMVVKIFKNFPEVAQQYSERFRYVMVDEYQDTNSLQFQLILGLTSQHHNLCVVGDDDQSIYSFRGADVTNILEFESNFPEAKVIKLEENYRSVTPILDFANQVIKENKNRREKTLWSQKASAHKPTLWLTADSEHESQVVVDEIVKHQSEGGHLGDIAVLYRSNTQAQQIEEQLRMSQVPYTIVGGQKFYEKKEVKDLMAYLIVLNNPKDQIAIRRVLNVPHRGIGTRTLEKYLAKAEEENTSLFMALKNDPAIDPKRKQAIESFISTVEDTQQDFAHKPLPEALAILIERIHYFDYIEKQHENVKQVDRRKNDIMMFIESAERFHKAHQQYATLEKFVEKVLLQDNQDTQQEDEDQDDDVRVNQVTLMTLHSSKGLEFRKVFLVGMEEEMLPHKRTIREGQGIEEERRLCYVGITRAQEQLYMTYCKERKLYGKMIPRHKSRFIHELEDQEHIQEQDRTTFGHLSEEEAEKYKSDFFQGLMDSLKDDVED